MEERATEGEVVRIIQETLNSMYAAGRAPKFPVSLPSIPNKSIPVDVESQVLILCPTEVAQIYFQLKERYGVDIDEVGSINEGREFLWTSDTPREIAVLINYERQFQPA